MKSIKITLPDGSHFELESGATVIDAAAHIGKNLSKAALAGKIDDVYVDLDYRLFNDVNLEVLTFANPEGREVYWHSTTHLMAQATKELFPKAQLTIGPPIEEGFYYDFDVPEPFTVDDLKRIEVRMGELSKANLTIRRRELSREEARTLFIERGEAYKVEMIDDIESDEVISIYEQGNFIDLCRGPHLPSTGRIKAFKLTSVAAAYWRGDERNQTLQRIYGVSYPGRKDLDEYLERRSEAERRDHRKLGKQLELFMFHPFAPASPFFFPKGARVYNILTDYVRELYQKNGYDEVITPLIYEAGLWKISGHYDHFWDEMFTINADDREYAPKAMNCPSHCLMFAAGHHSYRDLPIRYADFARLHRYERSGVTAGLMRVRSFSQDDAHIFCRPDQIQDEIDNFIKMLRDAYTMLGFSDTQIYLSTRPSHRAGTDDLWDHAESTLAKVLSNLEIVYELAPGEAAFYGPKIDFFVKDALGRPWQLGTCQLDFNMPELFELEYTTESGKPARPVMIHRAMLGSLERFLGVYLEHCAGAFPTWLAPVQAIVIGISEHQIEYVQKLEQTLSDAGIRVEADIRNEKIGYKIREAETKKIPYMVIVGAKEMEAGDIALRRHGLGDQGKMKVDELIKLLEEDVIQAKN